MPERALVDNDVALKISCYGLVDETVSAITIEGVAPAMLGVGRFVIRGRLAKARNIADAAKATAAFERLLGAISAVEPDEAELSLAADLEAEANRRDLELDGGESQLLAMLARRGCALLLTGDKRAISAIAATAAELAASRIACLEQLMGELVARGNASAARRGVCAEPHVDRAVTACFGCSRLAPPTADEVAEGLASYVRHLDRAAPGVLLPGIDLAGIAA